MHYARVCKKFGEEQNFNGTVANQLNKEKNMTERQKYLRPVIKCEDAPLIKELFLIQILGSKFNADGNEDEDVKRRVAMLWQ